MTYIFRANLIVAKQISHISEEGADVEQLVEPIQISNKKIYIKKT